jgi:hypothetical protein
LYKLTTAIVFVVTCTLRWGLHSCSLPHIAARSMLCRIWLSERGILPSSGLHSGLQRANLHVVVPHHHTLDHVLVASIWSDVVRGKLVNLGLRRAPVDAQVCSMDIECCGLCDLKDSSRRFTEAVFPQTADTCFWSSMAEARCSSVRSPGCLCTFGIPRLSEMP